MYGIKQYAQFINLLLLSNKIMFIVQFYPIN